MQRFGDEPQLMSDGNGPQRGGHQIHWTSISIGHQLRVHLQIVALRFYPIKLFKEAPYSFELTAVNTTLKSIISLSLNVCQRKLATTFFEYA